MPTGGSEALMLQFTPQLGDFCTEFCSCICTKKHHTISGSMCDTELGSCFQHMEQICARSLQCRINSCRHGCCLPSFLPSFFLSFFLSFYWFVSTQNKNQQWHFTSFVPGVAVSEMIFLVERPSRWQQHLTYEAFFEATILLRFYRI